MINKSTIVMRAVILACVSTQQQEFDRQIKGLTEYACKNGTEVVKIFLNKVLGAKKNEERTDITKLINYVKTNQVDKVLVVEISRLGHNTLEALKVLNKERTCLFVKDYNIETIDL